MNSDENETVADRMVRRHNEAQAAATDANKDAIDFVESGIDLALEEAAALLVEGVRKAVGEPTPLQALPSQPGTRHARFAAVSPKAGVKCQIELIVTGILERGDDPKKIRYVADVKGVVEVDGRGLETFEDSYDPARLGEPTFSGPGIAQRIEVAVANILNP